MKAFGLDIKKHDIRVIMRSINKDITETITFQEFANLMIPRIGNRDSKEEMLRIFKLFGTFYLYIYKI
jgi:centrin-1